MLRACSQCGASNRVPLSHAADSGKCGRCKAVLQPSDVPIAIDNVEDFDALVTGSKSPVLVDFWAPWCGPCRAVAPELDKLARARAGHVVIAKLNTDAVPDVAARFGIRSIPTMIRFDAGRETKRVSGAMAAPQISQAFAL